MNSLTSSSREFASSNSTPTGSPTDSTYSFFPSCSASSLQSTVEEAEEAMENPTQLIKKFLVPNRRFNVLPKEKKSNSNILAKKLAKLAREKAEDEKWNKYNSFCEVELNLSNEELTRRC